MTVAYRLLQVRLRLDEGAETMRLTLQQTTRSEAHLMLLLRERLERLQLPRPVRHIRLQALHFLALCRWPRQACLKKPTQAPQIQAVTSSNVCGQGWARSR